MKIDTKGVYDIHFGDWRIQLLFPQFEFVWDKYHKEISLLTDAPSFRLKRWAYPKADGTDYSYFSAGFMFVVGLGIEYFAGRQAAMAKARKL